jgi:uncharacterized protein YjbK
MQRIEHESKFELPADGFERLKSAGRIAKCEEQLNVYYDQNWVLADHAATLRVRFPAGDVPVLTLKIPVSQSGAKRVMKEMEVSFDPNSAPPLASPRPSVIDVEHELPNYLATYVLALGVRRLYRVGWVRNTRLVVDVESCGQLELDRLELPDGKVVYEAEIESADDEQQKRLARFVCQNVPEARPSQLSKFQRFRQATGRPKAVASRP